MDEYLDELLDERAPWREPLGDEPEADDGVDLLGTPPCTDFVPSYDAGKIPLPGATP